MSKIKTLTTEEVEEEVHKLLKVAPDTVCAAVYVYLRKRNKDALAAFERVLKETQDESV